MKICIAHFYQIFVKRDFPFEIVVAFYSCIQS